MKHKVLLLLIPYLFIAACSKDNDNGTNKSGAKEMVSFTFLASDNDELSEDAKAVLDKGEKKATVTLPNGTPVTSLKPVIEVSQGATIDPEDKKDTDFSSAVQYTITAEDGSTAVYTVSVALNAAPESFTLTAPEKDATGISAFPSFDWEAATDPDGDTLSYNLYLGTEEDALELYAKDLGATVYEPDVRLLTYQTYYWQVEALDGKGGATRSGIAAFTVKGLDFEAEAVTTDAPFDARFYHTSVTFDGKLWVIGGFSNNEGNLNDVWYSEDGATWTQATDAAAFNGRSGHTSVTFDNKLWVIGGSGNDGTEFNDVWYSGNGSNWTQATGAAPFDARSLHTSVTFDGKLWVIGGYNDDSGNELNDVWYSGDGETWTQATDAATFDRRESHTSVVFDNKIWVIGGYSSRGQLNDVWYSGDGTTWTQATDAAAFNARDLHTSAVFDDKLWVIGGRPGSRVSSNDAWYSGDGTTWTEATSAAAFSKRYGHTSAVFDDRLWVIGGSTVEENDFNDVWAFGAD
ncbi:hypothetical protein KIM67_07500 [Flagellimonas sp. 389]|uniref:Kelch repeat-containing protein n=1 Tax=Flagellimonas sp. 389 TaxID=2835862 RepID=UPI001BD6A931|nr:kelch repeat-containing protein [Flagellimonas sp. 389]MBS9462251.1 hypothetical protein [Flagellimonas sp. 389]